MRCSDFLPSIPPHFVSFAWRYHPCVAVSYLPSGCNTSLWTRGFTCRLPLLRRSCRRGDDGTSQVPGEPLCTCPALFRPRWDRTRQADFSVSMLPSATTTASAPTTTGLSRLSHTACTLAVYASQHGSPHDHARLASGCWPALPGGIGYPQGSDERFQLSITFSFPRLCLTHGSSPVA